MPPAAQVTLDRLNEIRQRWWITSLFSRIVLTLTISLGVLIGCIAADVLVRLGRAGLLLLTGVWCLTTIALAARMLLRSLRQQRTLTAAARRVEQAFPELQSHLINLVQLAESAPGIDQRFRQAALSDAADHVTKVRIGDAPRRHSRLQRWQLGLQTTRDLCEVILLLAATVTLALALNSIFPTWSSSIQRLMTPWRYVPQTGLVTILQVTPGNASVLEGSRLEIVAKVSGPMSARRTGELETWQPGRQQVVRRSLVSDPRTSRFRATIPAVMGPFRYRVRIGDSESEVYQVTLDQIPSVVEVAIDYRYPEYLRTPPKRVTQKHGDLDAPQFTTAELRIRSSTALSEGYLRFEGTTVRGEVSEQGKTLAATVRMLHDATYSIHLVNRNGHLDEHPRMNQIRVKEDQPPTVRLSKPRRDVAVSPEGSVEILIQASDDYGLTEVGLEWKSADEPDAAIQSAGRWPQSNVATAVAVPFSLDEPFHDAETGTAILVRAVALDGRSVPLPEQALEPQAAASVWRRIEIVDREAALSDQLERLDSWQTELWAVLKLQLHARLRSTQLLKSTDRESARQSLLQIHSDQLQIQKRSSSLADVLENHSQAAGGEDVANDLRRALLNVAHGDMQKAVVQADRASRLSTLERLDTPLAELTQTQDLIIATLRRLLEFTRKATSKALAEMTKRPGGDLPPDVQNKLRELRDKLEEFTKQQKRVIEATKSLAKKPVEDFSEEDEELLKQLAATEDDWSRFLEEMHSDFSKLPEQDFANASMLEELVEIQTEIKMAEGALTKKTADIAVPLEQLGAEMAEEMTTNLEKWLPDTPDRERWSQEESLTDADKEAPMAELPGELEDLVGELMEEEEDVMDEMEDVSSSAADSLDKGAGWDAADGPISNMSARGVTGNRLPNTSEIGGRSGEGRQGKASGEFVGDTAVGKGGRKTPSRLAPDPFVKGEVKDVSKDPVGGATGGGKESGSGAEGLEGPLRQKLERDMQRLAKKQADLRNRAEAVDVKFKVLNYHHEDLQKMIELMRSVERDLQSGRYRSALRRRQVLLEGLGHVKSYVDGEFAVRKDRSSNLPADIQKEVLSSMQEASPDGWEELNRKYFERLATEKTRATPAADGKPDPSAESPNREQKN